MTRGFAVTRGAAEFVLRLAPGETGKHVDFVLQGADGDNYYAALRLRAYANAQQDHAQTDVTDKVTAKFRNRLVTPLGSYAERTGLHQFARDGTGPGCGQR